MENHEFFMKRCLELGKKAFPNNSPNPMVGSVIVYKGKIIGEGYHKEYGSNHAEVNAINNVKDKSLLSHSIISSTILFLHYLLLIYYYHYIG